ncbi:MAG: membrane protein insertase YidC [Clostridiales bacterium]|nr:membrane protein insertase YidC [Clostridiaceae bacterium]MCD7999286.1 membrane protein insertase YidC [Clostridiales bacterium]
MNIINTLIGIPLGWIMWACYKLIHNYGIAIIVFTLLTKVIMFPISVMVQKNSIKMVKLKPRLDALHYQYIDDVDKYMEAQKALYKEEKYNPMAGVFPLFLQIPIILGLINVVYNPLQHLLHFPPDVTNAFITKTSEVLNMTNLGSSPQLRVVEAINNPAFLPQFEKLQQTSTFQELQVLDFITQIKAMDLNFFGINMASVPSVRVLNLLFLIPVLAGISSWALCFVQNKINVLQIEQGKLSQWGMTVFMVAFSTYFAFVVPAGVGWYWVWGNIFAILQLYLLNYLYNPKEFIDYEVLERIKKQAVLEAKKLKESKAKSKEDYKRYFAKGNAERMRIMFYSEQSGFYKYFSNIIDGILKLSDYEIHYVTGDPDDAIFQCGNPRIIPYYIDENSLIPLMMKVEADIVVMTMPDLEKYHIKRSKVRKDVEYIYTDHGCTSLNLTYRTGAFDHFDTIFAVGPFQVEEIRALEKLRQTKEKNILKCGYGLIDNMIQKYNQLPKQKNSVKTILIAPSWQEDNILDSCLNPLLESLLNKGYRIIVRPHPQYIRRFPTEIEKIKERYMEYQGDYFSLETDFSSNVTVYTADLVITDWSSIAYEFCFTTDKPVLFIDTKMKVVNLDYDKLDIEPVDIALRKMVGISLSKEETIHADTVIADLFKNQDMYSNKIHELKKTYFYNLEHSGEVAAEYIIERVKAKDKYHQMLGQ